MTEADHSPSGAIAVIFAGGAGTRMGSEHVVPKQFIIVDDAPIIVHTLRHFERHDGIERIYVVTLDEYVEKMWKLAAEFSIGKVARVVPGGKSAHESIVIGLNAAVRDDNDPETIVLIHDGVRPIITSELIDECIHGARERGSAVSAIPAFETIASAASVRGTVESVTERDKMYVLQAPQTFRLGEIADLNARAEREGRIGTFVDQAQLMNYYGKPVGLVPGFRGNVKITIPLDVEFFRFLITSGVHPGSLDGGSQ